MNEENFIEKKDKLKHLLIHKVNESSIGVSCKESIEKVIEVLNQYTYANRLEQKGRLSRIVIDSLNLDYNLGEVIIRFDNNIV